MGYLEKLAKAEGYMLYCIRGHFIKQSDPQNFSGGKTVVIDNDFGECPECDQEVKEAQSLLGRLGTPKGEANE
jgi:hypothetical protein